MVEIKSSFTHQMASPCSSKRIGVAIALCVLLLIHWSLCSSSRSPLTSTLLTFLLLLLSTSLPFLFPSIRQQIELDPGSLPQDEDVLVKEKEPTAGVVVTENSGQTADEEPSAEDDYDLIENSDDSISDDENLIEISLPDGHFVVPEEPKPMLKPLQLPADHIRRGVLMTNFLPESVVRQHGLMELLSEINEEDNLIEIDIARGSIKCSRVGILA